MTDETIVKLTSFEVFAHVTELHTGGPVPPIYIDGPDGAIKVGEGIRELPIITLKLADLDDEILVSYINRVFVALFKKQYKLRVRFEVEDD